MRAAPTCARARCAPARPRRSRARLRRLRRGRLRLAVAAGQATVEAVAMVPAVLVVGLAAFQLLAVGYAGVLAGGAAEAGALALAGGGDPRASARQALPGWSRARARIEVDGGRVEVRLRPPSPLKAVAKELEVKATAAVEAP